MSTPTQTSTEPQDQTINWKVFLETNPPGQLKHISGLVVNTNAGPQPALATPILRLYCGSKYCGDYRFFDSATAGMTSSNTEWRNQFINYQCRHCRQTLKTYAVSFRRTELLQGDALKIGEWPMFGPIVPTKMFSLLGEDQDLFHKGRRAESQGMGIGAFAYYRRVVENQKNRLIDAIIKVSKTLKADQQIIDNLQAARDEIQFHKAVKIIKDGIPEVLRISGHNPLTLLHNALSDGLHGQTDEECLARATIVRTVMADFSERVAGALTEQTELNEAVSKLLEIQNAKVKAINPPAKDESEPSTPRDAT